MALVPSNLPDQRFNPRNRPLGVGRREQMAHALMQSRARQAARHAEVTAALLSYKQDLAVKLTASAMANMNAVEVEALNRDTEAARNELRYADINPERMPQIAEISTTAELARQHIMAKGAAVLMETMDEFADGV